MKVLSINCGSSTLKFDLFYLTAKNAAIGKDLRIAHGIVDDIGSGGGRQLHN